MTASLPRGAAIVILGPGTLPLAQRLKALLPAAEIHGVASRRLAVDVPFTAAAAHIAALFAAGRPIVGLCAAGILIRAVAPLLADKRAEPPVVAVAGDGSAIVPLLGGHHGANDIARAIADLFAGVAAITTAGEIALGVALDAPPPGWRIAHPERAKPITAALLAGEKVRLQSEIGAIDWLSAISFSDDGKLAIRVTDRAADGDDHAFILHPPVLALGIGCERGCATDEIAELVRQTFAEQDLALGAIAVLVSIDRKMDEPALHDLAARLDLPVRFFSAEQLLAETARLATPSDAVFREMGCYGVAEGAALAAAGPSGALIAAKRKSARATCAVARAPTPLDAAYIGRARGSLAVIGIGPGDAAWRTREADRALALASDIVGYGLYLDLLGAAIAGKTRHESRIGAEEERVRCALNLAAEGRAVALISSGDAGIYGMAALVFELLEREDCPAWRRIDLTVVPGISALQAAAARLGAPLGHDFCAISLSDLLTPWAVIARRLDAAAAADFVIALYNPRSERRRDQLGLARGILLRHRRAETPVALARNLGRAGESVALTTLGDLVPDAVDMLTLVLIGSSATRIVASTRPRLLTPRGYHSTGRGEAS
jgi:cobalt-precorrin 5A hydrolase/precorrin-3B C17-methyltransferase